MKNNLDIIKSKLSDIGLTNKEADIMIYLFRDSATPSQISKDINISRNFVYERLFHLMELGFVSEIIDESKKKFRANKIDIIKHTFEEELQIKQNKLNQALNLLDKISFTQQKEININLLKGAKSIFYLLNNIIRDNPKEIYIMGSMNLLIEKLDYYFENFDKNRNKKKIKLNIVTSDSVNLKNMNLEFIEESQNSTNIFYNNKSILIFWTKQPTILLIEDKNFASTNINTMKNIINKPVKVFTTKKGIEYAYLKLFTKKDSTLRALAYFGKEYVNICSNEFLLHLNKVAKQKNIKIKNIFSKGEVLPTEMLKRHLKYSVVENRFLDNNMTSPVTIVTCNQYIIQIVYSLKEPQIIFMENKELSNIYVKHFDKLWKISK